MELSIFLAKVLGLYFLIVGIGILLNGQRIKGIITEIDSNPALLLFSLNCRHACGGQSHCVGSRLAGNCYPHRLASLH